ncbi:metal-dependent hydrolase [Rufibacter sp. LB8]|uniref:metal-dependent hydrolase n=1 Tax=Rufibacter sp. LB8 TaxID=2777781 RepID=UPI00178C7454|nr:metal-dependent hydrolase [Rufibacter sp. LB8]
MASAFAHAFVAFAFSKAHPLRQHAGKLAAVGAFCAVFPDADVLMFKLGVPYEHVLGHRGFSHSLVFALLLGVAVTWLFFRKIPLTSKQGMGLVALFTVCTASHALLDAMTSGGLGVAVFSPFDNTRYFLPWRPIQVSPIGVGRFFTQRGVDVLKSEFVYVGIPALCYLFSLWGIKKFLAKRTS